MTSILGGSIPTIMKDYTTTDITRAIGIPRERLKDWMTLGFVKPTIPAEGAGTKAVFRIEDLYGLQLFQHLLSNGFKRKEAAEIVSNLSRKIGSGQYLIAKASDGDLSVEILPTGENGRPIVDLLSGVSTWHHGEGGLKSRWGAPIEAHDEKEWDHIIIVNIGRIRRLVDQAVADL